MYKTDKIAILLATYNGEKYIAEQIDSLLDQTLQKWELFIHDDGSTDNTYNIILEYYYRYPEKIHILSGSSTGGAKENFFFLLKNIDAPYVMFCDQDDVWLNDKIEKTLKEMKKIEMEIGYNKPISIFTNLKIVDKNLNIISESMSKFQNLNMSKIAFKDIMIQNIVTGCTVMINKKLLYMAKLIDSTENIIMHDWWIALLASYFGKLQYISDSCILYRQHENNSVGAKNIYNINYISKKILEYKDIRYSLMLTQKQIEYFIYIYSLKSDFFIQEYAMLSHKSKIYRIYFLIKYNIWKHGALRNLGLVIFV